MPWINGEEVPGPPDEEEYRQHMTTRQLKHWDDALYTAAQPDYTDPVTELLDIGGWKTVEIVDGGCCIFWGQKGPAWPFEQCTKRAGQGTDHEGVGLCYEHGGIYGVGKVQGAILMANAYAQELNVTPWEALLSQVRLLANQVEWLKIRVRDAESKGNDAAIRPGGPDYDWVLMLEARGERLAKVSKMAIDAGVAERLVKQIELEAEAMFRAALTGLDAAGIEGEAREKFLASMSGKLLEIEAEHKVV